MILGWEAIGFSGKVSSVTQTQERKIWAINNKHSGAEQGGGTRDTSKYLPVEISLFYFIVLKTIYYFIFKIMIQKLNQTHVSHRLSSCNANKVENAVIQFVFPKQEKVWTRCFIFHQNFDQILNSLLHCVVELVSFSVTGQHEDNSPFQNSSSSLERKIKPRLK